MLMESPGWRIYLETSLRWLLPVLERERGHAFGGAPMSECGQFAPGFSPPSFPLCPHPSRPCLPPTTPPLSFPSSALESPEW